MSTIEIKREHGELDLINFSFRYIQLTEAQKEEIEKEFRQTSMNFESNLSKTNGYAVILDLDISVKYMGISGYGERKANLVIAEECLEIRDVKIPYSDLTDLVIYVDEYLGIPKEIFGIHHGGNNKIEFNHKGRLVSVNYVIKNKKDYDRVLRMVNGIEKNLSLKRNLKKLD